MKQQYRRKINHAEVYECLTNQYCRYGMNIAGQKICDQEICEVEVKALKKEYEQAFKQVKKKYGLKTALEYFDKVIEFRKQDTINQINKKLEEKLWLK